MAEEPFSFKIQLKDKDREDIKEDLVRIFVIVRLFLRTLMRELAILSQNNFHFPSTANSSAHYRHLNLDWDVKLHAATSETPDWSLPIAFKQGYVRRTKTLPASSASFAVPV